MNLSTQGSFDDTLYDYWSSQVQTDWFLAASDHGSVGEVLAIYYKKEIILKVFGYDKSIGLMAWCFGDYTYCSSEYLLDYVGFTHAEYDQAAMVFLKNMMTPMGLKHDFDPLYRPNCKIKYHLSLIRKFQQYDLQIISSYLQAHVRAVVKSLICRYDIKSDLTVCGGIFKAEFTMALLPKGTVLYAPG